MSQSQVWKKRSAGLANEYRIAARRWWNPKDADREMIAAASTGQKKAGMKRRKF